MDMEATRRKAKSTIKERPFRFLKATAGEVNLFESPTTKLLAECIVWQQRAGFGDVIDLRQIDCPCCHEHGFNTGFGYVAFVCGAEVLTDGEISKPCPKAPMNGATSPLG